MEAFIGTFFSAFIQNRIHHIGFILDGNRRFAHSRGLNIEEGHRKGFENLVKLVKFSQKLKIRTITLFVFSIHNFNRSEFEVEYLMKLLEESIADSANYPWKDDATGDVKLNFVGNLDLLPKRLSGLLKSKAEKMANKKGLVVNLCLSYCSDEEASFSALKLREEKLTDSFPKNNSNDKTTLQLFRNKLRGHDLFSPDIIIRTSGVTCLSDFLLWQISEFWPEFSAFDLLKILLRACFYK